LNESKFTNKESVSLDGIKEIFDAAYIECEFDKDGDLLCGDSGLKLWVSLLKEKSIITIFTFAKIKEDVAFEKMLDFANRMNRKFILARFTIVVGESEKLLYADYQMAYNFGLFNAALISTFNLFHRIVPSAIKEEDTDDIVE
jgi:hypothetical protein